MPQPRTHAATAVHGGHIYAVGGHFGHDRDPHSRDEVDAADLDLVHRYDPATDRWEEVAPLRRRRSHCEPGTFVFREKIVCVAGRNNSPGAVSRYDTITLALQIRRAIRKVKRILNPPKISGLDDVIAYDPASDKWFDVGTLPEPLYAPAAAAIGDEVIVSGGGRHGWRETLNTTIRLQLPEFT
jgi:N-acetylneuraminic acid mutarotase